MGTHYVECPRCHEGEKVMDPNRPAPLRQRDGSIYYGHWYPAEDGWRVSEAQSCACELTEEELEAIRVECMRREKEPNEP